VFTDVYIYIYIITDASSLRVLHVGSNFIGNDGMSLIARFLHGNTTLTELGIAKCGFSFDGMY